MTISALLDLRIAMAHYHVRKEMDDNVCGLCGLPLGDDVHAQRNIDRQRQTNSLVAVIMANRRTGP